MEASETDLHSRSRTTSQVQCKSLRPPSKSQKNKVGWIIPPYPHLIQSRPCKNQTLDGLCQKAAGYYIFNQVIIPICSCNARRQYLYQSKLSQIWALGMLRIPYFQSPLVRRIRSSSRSPGTCSGSPSCPRAMVALLLQIPGQSKKTLIV